MNILNKNIFLIVFAITMLVACKNEKKPGNATEITNAVVKDTLPQLVTTAGEESSLYAEVDISPMDMSYFPERYPQLKMTNPEIAPPIMRVIYSRPHLGGRRLFEEVIKYGQIWRLGANEATELDVFQPITIANKKIIPGRYSLYAIPKAGYWTIAVNTDLDLWGLKQDTTMDVVREQIPVTYYNPVMEYFTMVFEKTATGANLVMAWDDAIAKLPIVF